MKLIIDPETCVGHGRCYDLAPELIGCDDEGFPVPRGEAIEISPANKAGARTAAANCPSAAIKLSVQ